MVPRVSKCSGLDVSNPAIPSGHRTSLLPHPHTTNYAENYNLFGG